MLSVLAAMPSTSLAVHPQYVICEVCHCLQRCFGRLAVRRVTDARQQRDVDGAVTLLLRDLDLAGGAVLVCLALYDLDRNPNVCEGLRNIPAAEFRIEPSFVPAPKADVDIRMPGGQFLFQAAFLIGDLQPRDFRDGEILDKEMRCNQRQAADTVIFFAPEIKRCRIFC